VDTADNTAETPFEFTAASMEKVKQILDRYPENYKCRCASLLVLVLAVVLVAVLLPPPPLLPPIPASALLTLPEYMCAAA